jgi:Ca-dependent carbohydrate-binding module xylan-binding
MSETITRAANFLNTLGVNTHIPYTDGGYANIANVAADMEYLGVNQTRDGISNGYAGSAYLSSYITLAQEGIKFTFCLFGGSSVTNANITSQLALVDQLVEAVPGSVVAIEGANEINNFPVTFNGVGGLQGAINLQEALYTAVHSDPVLTGVAVDYFTGYGQGGLGEGPNPTTTAGLADYDTQHPYPNNGQGPYQWVNRTQALANETPANGPAVYTETGYSTNGGTNGNVNQDVQAKYTLDLLMDDAAAGIVHTDLYQLMDAYAPGSPQGDDGYGLFDYNNQPKEAATAIHNLTAILADRGTNAASFGTTTPNFSVSNLPSSNDSLVIEKSNGANDLVVWNEPQIWNESSGSEITAAATNVTVSLGATYQTVKVFDPLVSSSPTQTYTNVSSVNLSLTDHPLIVETEPSTTTPPSTTTSTITLNMSEDYYQGDAQFTVSVDGTQVGGVYSVNALHSSGDGSVFSLTGNWDAGSHAVKISFINDAYAGTPSTDRNLYINSIAYNGVTDTTHEVPIYGESFRTITVGSGMDAQPDPADTLTLHLAEDAYQGNAEFTLTIDGNVVSTPQAVTALHSAGAWQDFSFSGDLGAGSHTIGVNFVNDDYGGSASTDRNLYLNGITANGQNYATGAAALMSNGTENFTITTAH